MMLTFIKVDRQGFTQGQVTINQDHIVSMDEHFLPNGAEVMRIVTTELDATEGAEYVVSHSSEVLVATRLSDFNAQIDGNPGEPKHVTLQRVLDYRKVAREARKLRRIEP